VNNNPICEEKVSNNPIGGSGYYHCGLTGKHLVMYRSPTGRYLQIMEIKAWSYDYLNVKADPALVTSSNGPDNSFNHTDQPSKRFSPFSLLIQKNWSLNYGHSPAKAGFGCDTSFKTSVFQTWFMVELDDYYFIESIVITTFI